MTTLVPSPPIMGERGFAVRSRSPDAPSERISVTELILFHNIVVICYRQFLDFYDGVAFVGIAAPVAHAGGTPFPGGAEPLFPARDYAR